MLLFALERSRAQFAWKVGGLDAAALQPAAPAVDDDARRPAQAPRPVSRTRRSPSSSPASRSARRGTRSTAMPTGSGSGGRRPTTRPRSSTRCGATRSSGPAPPGPRCSPTAGSTSRRRSPPAPASRPTSGGCWSTCTTSTPATSATPTSSARPSTVWSERTRRSRHDGHARADPHRAADDRPGQRGVLGTCGRSSAPPRPSRCQCQRFKVVGWIWRDSTQAERTATLRAQTACGDPDAAATSGLVADVDDEPAGWVAVEPRTAYPKLRSLRVPWTGRHEDKDDDGVWAVTPGVRGAEGLPGHAASPIPSPGQRSTSPASAARGRSRPTR